MSGRDNTLLSRLGFQDRDKSDSRHDLGSRFLEEKGPQVFITLFSDATGHFGSYTTSSKCKICEKDFCSDKTSKVSFADVKTKMTPEVPISKGENQYKQTIGFLDSVLKFDVEVIYEMKKWSEEETIEREMKVSEALELKKNHLHDAEYIRGECDDFLYRSPTMDDLVSVSYPSSSDENITDSPQQDLKKRKYNTRGGSRSPPKKREVRELIPYSDALTLKGERGDTILINDKVVRNMDEIVKVSVTKMGWKDSLPERENQQFILYVEVKVSQTSIGDCLRQINLYREHIKLNPGGAYKTKFVLVTVYPFTEEEVLLLNRSEISWIKLGKEFDDWIEHKQKSGNNGKPALEF